MDAETRQEWMDGWPLIFSSTLGISVSSIVVYSMGVFMLPLQKEFGWSRAEISSGLLINSGFAIICAPFVGRLIDRLGPRRICLPGDVGDRQHGCAFGAIHYRFRARSSGRQFNGEHYWSRNGGRTPLHRCAIGQIQRIDCWRCGIRTSGGVDGWFAQL